MWRMATGLDNTDLEDVGLFVVNLSSIYEKLAQAKFFFQIYNFLGPCSYEKHFFVDVLLDI